MENKKNIFIALFLIVLVAGGVGLFLTNQKKTTITAIGDGKVMVAPGEVSMIITSAVLGNTADEAIALGESASNKLISSAKITAGAGNEIKKSFYQVTPQSDGKYLRVDAISMKSKNAVNASNMVKYMYTAGATTVSGITFTPKDLDQVNQQVDQQALTDAKQRAEKIVGAMGKKLGKMVSIIDSDGDTTTSVGDGTSSGAISVEKKLTVIYEVK